jgi:hypothetical protein
MRRSTLPQSRQSRNQATRTLVLGTSGTGKTFLSQQLSESHTRVIVLDPHQEWNRDFIAVFTWRDFFRVAKREGNWKIAVRIEDTREKLIDTLFRTAYILEDCLLIIDEGYMWFDRKDLPESVEQFNRFGRRRNLSLILITHRTVDIPPNIRALFTDHYLFRVQNELDRKRVERETGSKKLADSLARLPDLHYYHFDLRYAMEPEPGVVVPYGSCPDD